MDPLFFVLVKITGILMKYINLNSKEDLTMKKLFVMMMVCFMAFGFVKPAEATILDTNIDMGKETIIEEQVREYLEEGTFLTVDYVAVTQESGSNYRLYVRVHNLMGDSQIVYGLFNINTGVVIRSWSYSIIDGQGFYEEAYGDNAGVLDCIPMYQ